MARLIERERKVMLDPGDGWRFLEPKEITKRGDQMRRKRYLHNSEWNEWRDIPNDWMGITHSKYSPVRIRRRTNG